MLNPTGECRLLCSSLRRYRVLAMSLVALGCNPKSDPPDARAPVIQRHRKLMGTVFSVSVAGENETKATRLIHKAFAEIDRIETRISEWQDDSEVTAINAAAGDRSVRVSGDTLAIVKAGMEVSQWSEGTFDLTWAALWGLYRFGEERRHPTRAELATALPLVDWHDVDVDATKRTVFLKRTGMRLGTGGIGKGYALDRAAAILRGDGIDNFMLFAGGQVQVSGTRGDRSWRVGIQHPRADGYIGFLEARKGSIATSGDYEHYFFEQGKRWHHIIDVKTGMPATKTSSVTVIADKGIYSDALATAVFVLGPERGLQLLADLPFKAEAIIIDPQMRVFMTDGIRKDLKMRLELENNRLPMRP